MWSRPEFSLFYSVLRICSTFLLYLHEVDAFPGDMEILSGWEKSCDTTWGAGPHVPVMALDPFAEGGEHPHSRTPKWSGTISGLEGDHRTHPDSRTVARWGGPMLGNLQGPGRGWPLPLTLVSLAYVSAGITD
jgi:hypothetical protein